MTVEGAPLGTALDAALDYAANGWSVFPLAPGQKSPAFKSPHPSRTPEPNDPPWLTFESKCKGECGKLGHGLNDATRDVETLVEWFQGQRYNIGLAVPEFVRVLDVDKQHGGMHTLNEWNRRHGADWLFDVPRARTGNGGLHLFFGEDEALAYTSPDVVGIDCRHEGHYLAVAPSVHPNGNVYRWEVALPTVFDCPPMPSWIKELFAVKERTPTPTTGTVYAPGADELRNLAHEYTRWPELLTRHKWVLVAGDGESDGSLWRHSTSEHRYSASMRHDCLFLYSPTPGLPVTAENDPNGITLFTAISFLEYNGDNKATARALRMQWVTPGLVAHLIGRCAVNDEEAQEILAAFEHLYTDAERKLIEGHPEFGPKLVAKLVDQRMGRMATRLLDAQDNYDGDDIDAPWREVDLREALANGVVLPEPTVLRREQDRQGLMYAGCINGIHGDSGGGKSMLFAFAAVEQMKAGHHVAWCDLEDPNVMVIYHRLSTIFSVTDAMFFDQFHYYHPSTAFTDRGTGLIIDDVKRRDDALFVIDSIGEAFGLEGINEDKDVEVGPSLRRVPRRLADETGTTVATIDHATKAKDNPLHPSGSKRKRAAITGASFLVEAFEPITKEQGGKLSVICAKDRHGNYRSGNTVATLVMETYGPGLSPSVKLWAPSGTDDGAPGSKKATLDDLGDVAVRVAEREGRPLKQSTLIEMMRDEGARGANERLLAAIEKACAAGRLAFSKGLKNASLYEYVNDDEDDGP